MDGPFQVDGRSVSFWLRVKPRSSRDVLGWTVNGELCLRISAAPVEGQANEACVRFLAEHLRLPRSAVVIAAGHRARRKLVRIEGCSAEATIERLRELTRSSSAGSKARGEASKPGTVATND